MSKYLISSNKAKVLAAAIAAAVFFYWATSTIIHCQDEASAAADERVALAVDCTIFYCGPLESGAADSWLIIFNDGTAMHVRRGGRILGFKIGGSDYERDSLGIYYRRYRQFNSVCDIPVKK